MLRTSGCEQIEVDRSGHVADARAAKQRRLCEQVLGEGFDLQAHERQLLELAVQKAKGNLTHAAKLLGITRRQLSYRMKQSSNAAGNPGDAA